MRCRDRPRALLAGDQGYERKLLRTQIGDKHVDAFVYLTTDIDDTLLPYTS